MRFSATSGPDNKKSSEYGRKSNLNFQKEIYLRFWRRSVKCGGIVRYRFANLSKRHAASVFWVTIHKAVGKLLLEHAASHPRK